MPLDHLSVLQGRIVDAIAGASLAWQTPDQLASALGLEVDEVVDQLADMDGRGLVVAWEEWPQGVAVTFTPWAAEALDLRIVELGPAETPRWAPALSPEPLAPKARRIFGEPEVLALVVDPSPGPAELAELAEEMTAARRRQPERPGVWPDARRESERAKQARSRRKKKSKRRSKRECPA